MNLNEAQMCAVNHVSGPGICLAGPGSGKTATITRRVLHLVKDMGIPPGSILVITFTKAAAIEMKSRYEKLLYDSGGDCEPRGTVNFGTFHAFFFKILKQAYHLDASSIIRESEAYKLISDLVDDLAIEPYNRAEYITDVKNEISRFKGGRISIEDYTALTMDADSFRYVFKGYTEALRRRRLVDFDDMMTETEKLLRGRPDILDILREKYRYIMIDEFQDVNRQQYEITRMLAAPLNNLFIVGDDDQAIYGFRGSEPGIMLGFKKDYPDAKEYFLNVNYRSKRNIVEAAGRVISHNSHRFRKDIQAFHEAGEKIRVLGFQHQEDELRELASMIMEDYRRGLLFSQIAVLTRTNGAAMLLPGALTEAGVKFWIKEGAKDMYSHWACRDILGYIQVAGGDYSRDAMLFIANKPARYLSRDMFPPGQESFDRLREAFKSKRWAVTALDQLEFDLGMIKRASPIAAITYIRKAVRYDEYVRLQCERLHQKPDEVFELLEAFQKEARGFSSREDWLTHIEKVRAEFYRRQELDAGKKEEAVTITTIHGSKGLEYDSVYIIGAIEGNTPYIKAETEAEVEEERRMFYVAMTRAKMKLTISYYTSREGFKCQPSRFLQEMNE